MEYVAAILYILGGVASWAFLEADNVQDAKWWAKAYMVVLWPTITAALAVFVLLLFIHNAWGVWRYRSQEADE